jgi:putative glycerol kinase 5
MINVGAGMAHFFTRSKRFLAASIITLNTQHVVPRLYWALNNIEGAKNLMNTNDLCFGTIDTWLLWKLTNGKLHATDYSNVSTTVLYDPYQLKYSDTILNVMGFSRTMLPEVRDTGGDFGVTEQCHFGAEIPITAVISDQTSAMFAQGCWNPGDIKCTLGTGMFLAINTGRKPHASLSGYYPVIGWKIGSELTYLAEANFPSCGSAVEWGVKFGLFQQPSESEAIAESVSDSGGVCFVPAFDGIQVPYNDPRACAGIVGLTHNTQKEHMVRALLESLAYTFKQVHDVGMTEIKMQNTRLCVDGGVSHNNFVMQLASELLGKSLQRPKDVDMTVYGAVYVAGLASGFWKNREEISNFWEIDHKFQPKVADGSKEQGEILAGYKKWQQAVVRSLDWYQKDED